MKHTASMLSQMRAGTPGFQNNIDVTDLEPGTYTIQFSIINIQPSPNLHIIIPPIVQAIVTWKIEGQQQRRVISVVSGATITGVCEAVDVKILDINNQEDVGYEYQVQVTLSRGQRANTQQPPQLSRGRFVLVEAESAVDFPVPEDSGVISVFIYLGEGDTENSELQFQDAVNNTVAVLSPVPNATQWIPIIPGTTIVRVVNTNSPAPSGFFANLIWGIDG